MFLKNSGWEKSSGLLIHNCQALSCSWLFLNNLGTVTKLLHKKVQMSPLKKSLFLQILCLVTLHRWYEGWLEGRGQTFHLGMSNYSGLFALQADVRVGGCRHPRNTVNNSRAQDSLYVSVVVSRTHFIDIGVCEWESSKGLISFFIKCLELSVLGTKALLRMWKYYLWFNWESTDSMRLWNVHRADKGVGTRLKMYYSDTME